MSNDERRRMTLADIKAAISKGGYEPYHEEPAGLIYCGDCLEIMPHIPDGAIDLVVTDPPYGINHSSSYGATWMNTVIAGDSDTSTRDFAVNRYNNVVVFGTWKTPPIENVRGVLVWDKGPASGMGDLSFPWKPSWEMIYIKGDRWDGRRTEGVLRGPTMLTWENRGRVHPHQKPVWLITHFILKDPKSKIILDPFLGSGTTAVAAKQLGRQFIGIEINEDYCKIAVDRLRQEELFA